MVSVSSSMWLSIFSLGILIVLIRLRREAKFVCGSENSWFGRLFSNLLVGSASV